MNLDSRVEKLSEKVSIYVNKSHTFGTDALLLAKFSSPKRKDRCLDFCSGCGIIPLQWLAVQSFEHTLKAVDIQEAAIELMRASVEISGLNGKLEPVLHDLRDPCALGHASYDLITCNPPYKAQGSGKMSGGLSDSIARHETMCTIDDVCSSAEYLLRFGGRLCICQLPERLVDVLSSMRRHKIEPKRIQFVQQRSETAPWLFMVEGKRGSKPFLTIEPPYIIDDNKPVFG